MTLEFFPHTSEILMNGVSRKRKFELVKRRKETQFVKDHTVKLSRIREKELVEENYHFDEVSSQDSEQQPEKDLSPQQMLLDQELKI